MVFELQKLDGQQWMAEAFELIAFRSAWRRLLQFRLRKKIATLVYKPEITRA